MVPPTQVLEKVREETQRSDIDSRVGSRLRTFNECLITALVDLPPPSHHPVPDRITSVREPTLRLIIGLITDECRDEEK